MFDHIGFAVSDFPASRAFYEAALAPLGIGVVTAFGEQVGMGRDGRPQLWFGAGGDSPSPRGPAPRFARFTPRRSRRAPATTAGRACARTTIRTITVRLQSTSTATI